MISYTLTSQIPDAARANGAVIPSQNLVVSTAAVSFTAFDASVVELVEITISDQPVRVRWDTTDPTATVGHKLLPNLAYQWRVKLFNGCKFIRDTSATGDATIFASPLSTK